MAKSFSCFIIIMLPIMAMCQGSDDNEYDAPPPGPPTYGDGPEQPPGADEPGPDYPDQNQGAGPDYDQGGGNGHLDQTFLPDTAAPPTPDPNLVEYHELQNQNEAAVEGGVMSQTQEVDEATAEMNTELPPTVSLKHYCDHYIVRCMRVFNTGRVCGRSIYYNYHDFKNYCTIQYLNCMENNEVWTVAHMGGCLEVAEIHREYIAHYTYVNDNHLDQYYVLNDW